MESGWPKMSWDVVSSVMYCSVLLHIPTNQAKIIFVLKYIKNNMSTLYHSLSACMGWRRETGRLWNFARWLRGTMLIYLFNLILTFIFSMKTFSLFWSLFYFFDENFFYMFSYKTYSFSYNELYSWWALSTFTLSFNSYCYPSPEFTFLNWNSVLIKH